MMPFDRPHTISYKTSITSISVSCTVILALTSQNLQRSHDPEHIPFSGNLSFIGNRMWPTQQCINQHTTPEVLSFTESEDMIGAKFKKMT